MACVDLVFRKVEAGLRKALGKRHTIPCLGFGVWGSVSVAYAGGRRERRGEELRVRE